MTRYFSLAAYCFMKRWIALFISEFFFGNTSSHSNLAHTNQLHQTPSTNQLTTYYIDISTHHIFGLLS